MASLGYKIQQDEKRLSVLEEKIASEQGRYQQTHRAFMTFGEIEQSGKKTFTGKYSVSAEDYEKLTTLAKQSYSAVSEAKRLREENQSLTRRIWSLQSEVAQLQKALAELTERCRPYLEAVKAAPKAVKEFVDGILEKFKKQEKSIVYEPIALSDKRRHKSRDIER